VRRSGLVLAAGILLLASLPYVVGGVSPNFITLDDFSYIAKNPQVIQGLTPRTALWALTSTEDGNWYPLRRLSHLVDVSLFGLDARGHHLVSVGWHAAAALLLFLALHRMTGRRWRSFVVAGLFAAHPLQVESVAWAAERSNVQTGFFFALTLLLWARYARRPSWGRYGAVLCSCALGLTAKPMLMTLPFLLLLLDLWPLGRLSKPGAPPWRIAAPLLGRRLLEKAPLFALAAASGAMAVFAHRQLGALPTFESLPLSSRLANAALSFWRYLGKLLWPADLAVFYPHPGAGIPAGPVWAAALLLAAATALALLSARRRPWLAAGWLWYAGTLAPMSGIVQFGLHAMADRFVYLPAIGIFLAFVWTVAEDFPAPLRRPALLAPLAGAALAALGAVSAVQTGYWKDSETLFRHALAVTRENWMIRHSLGVGLAEAGRHEEAIVNYREAVRIQPKFADFRYNMGGSLAALGRHEEAVEQYRAAVPLVAPSSGALGPEDALRAASIQYNLGISLFRLGRRDEAAAAFREAIRLRPDNAAAWFNLGSVMASLGRRVESSASYREAVRLRPEYAGTIPGFAPAPAGDSRAGRTGGPP
jgi:Flp pilus assembly protein TadD